MGTRARVLAAVGAVLITLVSAACETGSDPEPTASGLGGAAGAAAGGSRSAGDAGRAGSAGDGG